ncbi:MAG: BadF/BadG/BcrA/BcrD ATPase family protein [Anaerolineae bacterium]
MAYMGIDGGGSTLRVAIVDAALTPLAEVTRSTANPSVIGREAAASLIQSAMRDALSQVSERIEGVGIGVAGASAVHSAAWLLEVVTPLVPRSLVVPSTDMLIALVGAHGALRDVMVLAGTGSVALAINDHAEPVQAGGWGYLLGDEGSGFWLAMEAMRACMRWHDRTLPEAHDLAQRVMGSLGLAHGMDLIPWVYRQPTPTRDIAAQASLVLEAAADGDAVAQDIVTRGARALAALTRAVIARAELERPAIQFCGGLLSSDNGLSMALCQELELANRPIPLYPPVIGAALLAKIHLER